MTMRSIAVPKVDCAERGVEDAIAKEEQHRDTLGHLRRNLGHLMYRLVVRSAESRLGETDVSVLACEAEYGPGVFFDVFVGLEEGPIGD